MSTLLEPVVDFETSASTFEKEFKPKLFNNNRNLKSKENTHKIKYRRELKKKLKKYKLRRDGQENPEVLDVSKILVTSLKIKSPNNKTSIDGIEDELRPANYLFKMGRKKQTIKKKIQTTDELVSNDMQNKKNKKDKTMTSVQNQGENTHIFNTNYEQENLDIIKAQPENIEDDSFKKIKDKKQTNAFTLMMDSRNKSLGCNSPGKEKVAEDLSLQESIEKKSIKAKRNLLLQKMSEAKGALKKKELEEYQEKCIKKKMDKRAERLKNMIKGYEPKSDNNDDMKTKSKIETIAISVNENEELTTKPLKTELKLVNIFKETDNTKNIPNKKKEVVSKEDHEFLNKLSPSLKKKENMLCYFKKVDKEQDELFDEKNSSVIKVKLKLKGKNKIRKKKLSLNKDRENMEENRISNGDVQIIETSEKKINKDKQSLKGDEKVLFSKTDDTAEPTEFDIMRPRRNVKRPAKYIDEMQVSSSDEELHIFTPKKKKHANKNIKQVVEKDFTNDETTITKSSKAKEKSKLNVPSLKETNKKSKKDVIQPKKHTKLAPIFALKPQLDQAAIEAKQKFLSSGVPEKLKKQNEKQANKTVGTNNFHTVVHVQQKKNMTSEMFATLETILIQGEHSEGEIDGIVWKEDFFKKTLTLSLQKDKPGLTFSKNKTQVILQNMKHLYPKFPVYRTYRLLRDRNRGEYKDCSYLDLDNSIEVINGMVDISNESPDRLSWTDKYKAISSKQIIGNFESIKEIKKWLISWTENDNKPKKNDGDGSDSSDFYSSDTDSKDSMKCTNNLLILTGPVGSGKTSLVYAVAAELAIKVLEVNASNKRTGKIMLQDLQEATQSHKVNRGKSSQEMSQKSQEVSQADKPKVKKRRGRPKKVDDKIDLLQSEPKSETLSQLTCSQDIARTCMSLILIDDADIVFDQDDGFCTAIVQLVQCSKRPVILITSSTSCLHLQRFLQCAKIIHTRPLFPRMLGTWLDIMCLADGGTCWPGLGAKCLDYFKGDIRKAINFLHFQTAKNYVEEDSASQNVDDYGAHLEDDENSNMSWSGREGVEEKNENRDNVVDHNIWHYFMRKDTNLLHFIHPVNIFRIWWNIPRLMTPPTEFNINGDNSKARNRLELDVMANVADMISVADYYCLSRMDMESELISFPWRNFETHSVSEHECLDKYDRNCEVLNEISHNFVSGSIMKAQKDLKLKSRTDLEFPNMVTRREKDRIADRHGKLSSFLSPSAVLDRRGLALDYWSGCRAICRVEQNRTDSNFKRNNRFCHYLKSANILCKSDSFDNLANSLQSNKNN